MKRTNPLVPLRHMLDYAREALALSQGKSRSDLDTNRLFNLALTHLVELIGEAASRVRVEDRPRYPDIPWAQVVSMRNRLIHGYDMVDLDIGKQSWKTCLRSSPPWKRCCGRR